MNNKQIECILEVAKTLNFNRASENLYISQPTLSYQIKTFEDEIGVKIFNRNGNGVSLTLAGKDFCTVLDQINKSLHKAIEHAQNINQIYSDEIRICMQYRSSLYYLSDAIKLYKETHPEVIITPTFNDVENVELFLKHENDVLFALEEDIQGVPGIIGFPLFVSNFYIISNHDDELTKLDFVKPEDLIGRTLIVGGKASKGLKKIQKSLIENYDINYINSPIHDATLLHIKSQNGICLAPGFLNDFTNEFAWTTFMCDQSNHCFLVVHENESRKSVFDFIELLQNIYRNNVYF